jgi:hypothetical protein
LSKTVVTVLHDCLAAKIPVEFEMKQRYTTNGFGRSFSMFADQAWETLAYSNITQYELKVYAILCACVTRNKNSVVINARELSEKLCISMPAISKAFKGLIEKELILKEGKLGAFNCYKVSPHLLWKGEGQAHRTALGKTKRPKLMIVRSGKYNIEKSLSSAD